MTSSNEDVHAFLLQHLTPPQSSCPYLETAPVDRNLWAASYYRMGRDDNAMGEFPANTSPIQKMIAYTAYSIGENHAKYLEDQKTQAEVQIAAIPRQGKVKIAPPTKYSGDRTKYNEFVTQCHLNFAIDPNAFAQEQTKMAFIGSYLEKHAYTWFASFVDKEGVIDFADHKDLLEKLKRGFADPDELATANREIRKLKQTSSVAAYFSDFSHWANILDLDENARRYQFEEGLSDEVKDGLAVNPNKPTAFEDYVDMCSVIENQLFARRQTKKRSGNAPRQNEPVKKTVETKTTTQQLAVTGTHSGPMDTSAGAALTGKARTEWRKANNLCPYCGDKHKLEVCPKLAAKNSRAAAATTTTDTPAQVLYTSVPSEN